MSALIITLNKGQRADLTAQMKDADEIVAAFREYGIQFDKKYTSLNTNGPSTITFKGIRAEGTVARLTDLLEDLHGRAKQNMIGNVYLRFSGGYLPKKDRSPEKKGSFEAVIPSAIVDIAPDGTEEEEDPTL